MMQTGKVRSNVWQVVLAGVAILATVVANAADPVLKKGARLAIVGDSITEQKLYSKYMETYLVACRPDLEVSVLQYGWSGERAPGFLSRMDYDLLPWKPDVATTCYGMNDGGYRAYTNTIGATYLTAMSNIVAKVKAAGGTVVVGSPGVVDSRYYGRGNTNAAIVYNDNLDHLRVIARDLAAAHNFPFADVYSAMMMAMQSAKAARGFDYAVAGRDGVHPGGNGHVVMAYAFLKALGMDGQIGTLTVQWGGQAEATAGHTVQSFASGTLTVESSRYPFCFAAATTNGEGMATILPFTPFQQELNRFTLVVKGLPTAQAEVKWGTSSKVFSKEQLAAGINLAAEFIDNPFSAPFAQVMDAVGAKQAFETGMVKKQFVEQRKEAAKGATEAAAAVEARTALLAEQATKVASVRALVKPVSHQIQIVPVPAK